MQLASKQFPLAATVAGCVLLADLLTKWLANRSVGPGADVSERWLVGDWLGLSYSRNSGIAFGLLRERSAIEVSLAVVAALGALGLLVWSYRGDRRIILAGALVGGGAIGNLIDRARFGYVRDYIAVGPWPPFNLADSAITIGAIALAVCLLRANERGVDTSEFSLRSARIGTAALDTPE